MTKIEDGNENTPLDTGRRKFLGTAALAGLAGAGMSIGLTGCKKSEGDRAGAAGSAEAAGEYGKYEVPPGKLDDYYMFSSGGHSGDMRIYGLPSGRTLKQIPVFNTECMIGWGLPTNPKRLLVPSLMAR